MLVDPEVLLARPVEVLAVVAMVVGGKYLSKLAFAIVAGYPSRVAVTVAAGLAQVGEFTFILVALATQLGILPVEGFQLAVAGAVISITINPLVFRFSDWLEPILRESRLARAIRARRSRDLDRLTSPLPELGARRHAILVGYGRVGSLIGNALQRRGFAFVVIEQDRRLVERLRASGMNALYGDASDPAILERAGVDGAIVLVIAVADEAASAVVLERARRAAPRLDIVVRTHAERTATRLHGQARVWPIVGERELGVQMARTALRRFGVSGTEAEAIAQGLRSGPPGPPPPGPPTNALPRLKIRERLRSIGRRGRTQPTDSQPPDPASGPAPAPTEVAAPR
jgi:CPA2 family monovalent cation:H+ antiporter-2